VVASEELVRRYQAAKAAVERRRFHAKDFFEPYRKQQDFLDAGAKYNERLISAGNQLGKTTVGAFEAACHLTGEYPSWWRGRRFQEPVNAWAASINAEKTRDGVQAQLCGKPGVPEEFGTGMIPKAAFLERPSLRHGTHAAFDTARIRHASGGISILKFKSYDQGEDSFQSETLHFIWNDEEPPERVYSEELPRIAKHDGIIFITFTPLKGVTAVVRRYLYEPGPNRIVVKMGIYEVGHYTKERADAILAAYPDHERAARGFGDPMLGEGAVFTTSRGNLLVPAPQGGLLNVPLHWRKLWGIDFGVGHPFGAVLTAWDQDTDIFYVLYCVKIKDGTRLQHIPAIRSIASEVPVAWPHDMTQRRETGDGDLVQLAKQYRDPGPGQLGLNMLPTHATFAAGGYSFTAGIDEIADRMQTNRFKVLDIPENVEWMNEYGAYHREKGQVVKEFDDLMSATRQAIMAKRHGRPMPIGSSTALGRRTRRGEAALLDPWTGKPI
jgi:phage terminase large subunit-like protein